jgi:hypothetical protein
MPNHWKRKGLRQNSNDLVSFPAGRFRVVQTFGRVWLVRVPVDADEGVRVVLLIEIAEGVIDFAMLALIRANYRMLVMLVSKYWDGSYCKEEGRASFDDPLASSSNRRRFREPASSPTWVSGLRQDP